MLLVLGKHSAQRATAFLSLLRIRDFMLPSLSPSLVHLQILPAIIYVEDAVLYEHLRGVRPFFALAATLTLYAHEVEDYSQIARLYDFLLAHEAAVSIYFFAVIILSRKEQLLEIPVEDSDILNFVLSKLPKPLDLENLIGRAMVLFAKHPPGTLPFRTWRSISASSVLKTTQSNTKSDNSGVVRTDCTIEQGQQFFMKQMTDLKREETRQKILKQLWKRRRPLTAVTAAVLVGVLSVWIQRNGATFFPWFRFRALDRLSSLLRS